MGRQHVNVELYSDLNILAISMNKRIICNTTVVQTLQLSQKHYSICCKEHPKFSIIYYLITVNLIQLSKVQGALSESTTISSNKHIRSKLIFTRSYFFHTKGKNCFPKNILCSKKCSLHENMMKKITLNHFNIRIHSDSKKAL